MKYFLINSALALFFVASTLCASDDFRNISDPEDIVNFVRASGKTVAVFGCGLTPYAWQEAGANNLWRKTEDVDGAMGDHAHEDAITFAESVDVQPNVLYDITQPLPEGLDGCFQQVCLERLPPFILCIPVVWQNASAILCEGGALYATVQRAEVPTEENSYVTAEEPFILHIKQPKKMETHQEVYEALRDTNRADLQEYKNITMEQFNALERGIRIEMSRLLVEEKHFAARNALAVLEQPHLRKVKNFVEKFGFKAELITIGEGGDIEVNPFNQRTQPQQFVRAIKVTTPPEEDLGFLPAGIGKQTVAKGKKKKKRKKRKR